MMMICIYPWPWQYVLTVCVSMMMICIHPRPWQYVVTLRFSMMICIYPWPRQYILTICLHDDLYTPLALAIRRDRMCLHDDLYIPLALAIRLDHMCLCDNDLHWSKGLAYVLIYISHWYVYRDGTFYYVILEVHGDLMNQFWKEIKI